MTKDLTASQESTMAESMETADYFFKLETIIVKYMEMKWLARRNTSSNTAQDRKLWEDQISETVKHTWDTSLFKLVYVGRSMSNERRQIS